MGITKNAGFGIILCLSALAGCESQPQSTMQYREADAPLQAPANNRRTETTALPMGAGDSVGRNIFAGLESENRSRREGTATIGN